MVLGALSGFTVAVTADRRHEEQIELLRRRGARVLHAPTIRTVALDDDPGLADATDALIADPPDIVVLTTGVGTRGWLSAAEGAGRDAALRAALNHAQVIARGPKAAGAAVTAGLELAWAARSEQSSEIVGRLVATGLAGARVAVQRDGHPEPLLARALGAGGADVVDVVVYRWTLPERTDPADRLIAAIGERRVDAVTVTSSPALANLLALAADSGCRNEVVAALAGPVTTACVGPVCADNARIAGIADVVQPRRARLGAMVQALTAHLGGRAEELALSGVACRLQGASLVVGDHETVLSARERAVLEVLVAHPGRVVAKATLLAGSAPGTDLHAVEAAVGRLRRRLGPAGDAVETIPRRGYRLVVSTPADGSTSRWSQASRSGAAKLSARAR